MNNKYYKGYKILVHGCCDTATMVEILPKSKENFDDILKKTCIYYERNLTTDEILELGTKKLTDISTENTLDALAISVVLDRSRIYEKRYNQGLDKLSQKLATNFIPLKEQYIIEHIPGPYS